MLLLAAFSSLLAEEFHLVRGFFLELGDQLLLLLFLDFCALQLVLVFANDLLQLNLLLAELLQLCLLLVDKRDLRLLHVLKLDIFRAENS